MNFFVYLCFIFGVIVIDCGNCLARAENGSATNTSSQGFSKETKSTDWRVRVQAAKKLAGDHSRDSFATLLELLKDKHVDVSYAAAEILEARKDVQFDSDLIAATKALPTGNRWPAYRAMRNYPTRQTLDFLLGCLHEEIKSYRNKSSFDDRNCFYLASSLETVCEHFPELQSVKAPEDRVLAAYDKFASDLERRLKTMVPRTAK